MAKKFKIQKSENKEYNLLKQAVFKKVKDRYDWAMKMTNIHIAHMPYFQQYFFANMEKPNFKSEKIKDKLYIEALREFGLIPEEGIKPQQYMYNAFETKYGEKLNED